MGLPSALSLARRAEAARTLMYLPSAVPTSRGAQPTCAAMRCVAAVLSVASGAARSSGVSALQRGAASAKAVSACRAHAGASRRDAPDDGLVLRQHRRQRLGAVRAAQRGGCAGRQHRRQT